MLRVSHRRVLVVLVWVSFLFIGHHLLSHNHNYPPFRIQPVLLHIDSPWTRRIERYPVDGLQQLPNAAPLSLPRIQVPSIKENATTRIVRESRLASIKATFLRSWQGYRENAWLADELKPVSGGRHDAFGNWAATLVDSLDTLWIMGFHQEFNDAIDALSSINFESSTSERISVFETTIRYLGGMLSAYELSGREILLQKAVELANMLYAAFDTSSRLPISYFEWRTALNNTEQDVSNHAASADIGSLGLEFTKLSQLTGDMRYYDAAARIADLLAEVQNETTIPGLWPIFFDARYKDFISGNQFSFGALADSLYEYTIKMHILLGGTLPHYGVMYQGAINAAKKHLFFRPMNPQNRPLLFSSVASVFREESSVDGSVQHLACFVGGMVGMGAKIFEQPDDLEAASMLSDGCYWAYESMPSGIMPETFTALPCPSTAEQCQWDEEVWQEKIVASHSDPHNHTGEQLVADHPFPRGFVRISDGRYILRPEAIESLFYMYRITGDTSWQDKAWVMYTAIENATRTTYGYSAIKDVSKENLELADSMESFWMAETLKYLYLIFSPFDVISLDEWVFNTEAHPFRRALPRKGLFGF